MGGGGFSLPSFDEVVNSVNPFDGNNGQGILGYANPAGPLGEAFGVPSFQELIQQGFSPQQAQAQIDSANGTAEAMNNQARASVEAAQIAADAATSVAQTGLAGTKLQVDAQVKTAQMSGLAGIVGAALGANTTHEEIKQWLPHEAGAATIASWDLAQKWNKTLQMRTAGYQDAAINYELSGKKGASLFSDAQWNTLKMADMTRKDMMASVQTFGIQSPSNPTGIKVSAQEWEQLNSFKDPSALLKVDPAVAAKRNAEYDSWAKQMRASGKGIIVDMYENPQLAGSNILTMKGKDPMLDPAMGALIGTMMQGQDSGGTGGKPKMPMLTTAQQMAISKIKDPNAFSEAAASAGNKQYGALAGITGLKAATQAQGKPGPGGAFNVQNWSNAQGYQSGGGVNNGTMGTVSVGGGGGGSTDWDAAIRALTQGEKNPMTDQINWAMDNGIVDKYGMVSAGALQKFIPPSLMSSPEFNLLNEVSPQQKIALTDQYNQYASMKVDPKLIREESMGMGMIKRIKLNPDGTIASSAIEGTMIDAMGNSQFVSMQGNSLQDWAVRQGMIDGMGPNFGSAGAYMSSSQSKGSIIKNVMATGAQGVKGSTAPAPAGPISSNLSGPQLKTPKAGAAPSGYTGAPLAAGEG